MERLAGDYAVAEDKPAGAAGVTLQTASAHLAKLEAGGLLAQRKQGRHRYFALADDQAGRLLESIMGFAANRGHLRARAGPRDPALRKARVCYNHLAGDYGVRLLDRLVADGDVTLDGDDAALTPAGETRMAALGIDLPALKAQRRPVCRTCLDWSERRSHLAGSLGEALLARFIADGWAKREKDSRAVRFTGDGERKFMALFP